MDKILLVEHEGVVISFEEFLRAKNKEADKKRLRERFVCPSHTEREHAYCYAKNSF